MTDTRDQADDLVLHTFIAADKCPSLSPPCAKFETWLRMADIPHAVDANANLAEAPKGKVPFIDYRGRRLSDSTLMIDLFRSERGVDLDADLSARDRAISVAFRRMIKENMYWHVFQVRYHPDNYPAYRAMLGETLFPAGTPEDVWGPILDSIRDRVQEQSRGHGIGLHDDAERTQIATADFQALSDLLGDQPYYMGDAPTTLDATAFGYVSSILYLPYDHPIKQFGLSLDNVVAHCERVQQRYFPELGD
jgi:glutathione S-transferase